MNDLQCGTVRELIPDLGSGRADLVGSSAVDEHIASCSECRAELELARLLYAGRPEVPDELDSRVLTAVRGARSGTARPWWGVSAAAVAALALGIGIRSEPSSDVSVDVPGYAYEVDEGALWSSDDGLLAGAPMLEDLSDDALAQLLDELMVGSSGGAA